MPMQEACSHLLHESLRCVRLPVMMMVHKKGAVLRE